MIECYANVWINPVYVVRVTRNADDDVCVWTVDGKTWTTPLPIATVVGMVGDANS